MRPFINRKSLNINIEAKKGKIQNGDHKYEMSHKGFQFDSLGSTDLNGDSNGRQMRGENERVFWYLTEKEGEKYERTKGEKRGKI